jgi:hypothetical protein
VVIVFEQALAVVRFEHLRNERPDVINMGTASIKSFVVCEGVPQKLVNENSGQIVDVFVFVVRFDRLDDPVALGRNLTITLTTAQLLIDKRIDDAADRVPLPAFLFYEASAGSRPRRPRYIVRRVPDYRSGPVPGSGLGGSLVQAARCGRSWNASPATACSVRRS